MTLRFGRYETIAQIASGGMATVYLGRAVGVGGFERKVAIKVMHDHIADDPDFVAMFLDEARLAARIHHPNVVGTMDVQKTDEAMFLVMEYIEGASLRRVLRACKKEGVELPLEIALRIMVDMLNGLHAAHELKNREGELLNLVHRDVSPHNILVGVDGVGRITDFGVARAEARLGSTRGGQLKGKIAYMPPEQGRGGAIDRRADVYAAGVVFWESLTLKRLFKAEHEGALIAMILTGCDRPPRTVNPMVPEAIDAVCMKALAVDPEDRYASTADFAEAIETAAHEAGIRIASTRKVADFIDDFKVTIDTKRPPPLMNDDSMSGTLESRRIEVDAPITSSEVADPSSQMTGIGAVQSVRLRPSSPPPRSRRSLGFVAVGVAAAFVIGVVAFTGEGDKDGASSPAAGVEEGNDDETAGAPTPPAEVEPDESAEARAGKAESGDADDSATGDAEDGGAASKKADDAKDDEEDAKKAAAATPPAPRPASVGVRPKVGPPKSRPPAPKPTKGPFGYEPDDL